MTEALGTILILVGLMLISARHWGAHHATELYKKMGFEVSQEQYTRQFVFVGIVLTMLGAGLLMDLF